MLNISGHQSNKNIGSDTSYTNLDPGPYVAIVKQNVELDTREKPALLYT